MGVFRTAFACSFCGLLLVWFASITYAFPACFINIGVAIADFARTVLVKVLALRSITSITDAVLSGAIWVGEVVAVPAFSVLAEDLSSSTGVRNASTQFIDVLVIRANFALVAQDVHLILLRITLFTLTQNIENLF